MEKPISPLRNNEELRQEICECGCRRFFIFCNHRTVKSSEFHDWFIICQECGRTYDQDDIAFGNVEVKAGRDGNEKER